MRTARTPYRRPPAYCHEVISSRLRSPASLPDWRATARTRLTHVEQVARRASADAGAANLTVERHFPAGSPSRRPAVANDSQHAVSGPTSGRRAAVGGPDVKIALNSGPGVERHPARPTLDRVAISDHGRDWRPFCSAADLAGIPGGHRGGLGARCRRSTILRTRALLTSFLLLAVLGAVPTAAQELEPRAYSASPIGTNFLVVGVVRSSGDVLFDPTRADHRRPREHQRAPRSASDARSIWVDTCCWRPRRIPYVWGDMTGNVAEQARAITRVGPWRHAAEGVRDPAGHTGTEAGGIREGSATDQHRHEPHHRGADRAVLQRQADQPRDEPLGVQARGRAFASDGSMDARSLGRPVALHLERSVLPGRLHDARRIRCSCSRRT